MGNQYVGLRVEINGEFSDKEWIKLRLDMANARHVVGYAVQRHYLGANSRNSGRAYYTNRSRIRILFGEFPTSGLSNQFQGYITKHTASKADFDGDGKYVDVTYYVVGTSHPMQAKHNWTGLSWSGAAKAVAKRHKLKAVVHQTPRLSRPLIQTESDFKFLVRGADASGYRFFVWNTTLYFVNPQKMLNTRVASTPFFEQDAVHELDVEASEAEDSVYEIQGTGADGSAIKSTTTAADDDEDLAPRTPEYDATVVADQAEAQQALEARVLSDKNWVTAEVELDGDARVIPGKVVYLNGDNTADEHKGLWIVNSVKHVIDIENNQNPKQYHLEATLARDRLRSVNLPTNSSEWIDISDPDETVPWDATDEWANNNYDDSAVAGGVWQAEFYGDTDG